MSETETGSPTRGGRVVKVDGGYKLNGVKTFTSMSKALTHFIVGAYVEETELVGFFLVPRSYKGVEVAENWNIVGMRTTESHDLVLNDVFVPNENYLESYRQSQPNEWLLHIPSCYLGIAQAARDYAVNFVRNYSPNSITGIA